MKFYDSNLPVSKMKKPLGKAIKSFRLELQLNQTELAEKSQGKFKQSYLSRIEAGQVFPSSEILGAVVESLGCSLSELWSRAEDLAEADLYGGDRTEYIECLRDLGDSFEDVQLAHNAICDRLAVKLFKCDRRLHTHQSIGEREIREAEELVAEVHNQTSPESLAAFAGALGDLLVGAMKQLSQLQQMVQMKAQPSGSAQI